MTNRKPYRGRKCIQLCLQKSSEGHKIVETMKNMNRVFKIQGQTMCPTVSSEGHKIVVHNG